MSVLIPVPSIVLGLSELHFESVVSQSYCLQIEKFEHYFQVVREVENEDLENHQTENG
jgi:Asp-tRNA(Asn)/Glu-tRNA(Gln) amidotransferase C subunit